MTATHYYAWRTEKNRKALFGRPCRILAASGRNSLLVEFTDDGQREVVSRRAVRRILP